MPGLGCGRTPWGCLVLGVVGSPVGAPVLASWPYCLGGVSRHPPGTVVDPSRPRLWQWVAVSAASETACRRAAVHLPACLAVGGAVPSGESGVRSAASWLTRCASCAPLPQPTPFGMPGLGCGRTPWGMPGLGCGPTPWGVAGLRSEQHTSELHSRGHLVHRWLPAEGED